VAPYGVTVNNVMPGYTRTARVDELARSNAARKGTAADDEFGLWERQIPMGRLGEPGGVRGDGGVPLLAPGELHHRGQHPGGRRVDPGPGVSAAVLGAAAPAAAGPAARMAQLSGEGALDVFRRATELERQGRPVVHLELGAPTWTPRRT
jgi:NAD(P)-dependent dehydrogenase (short-subunit alcohol dehydrogenase family)